MAFRTDKSVLFVEVSWSVLIEKINSSLFRTFYSHKMMSGLERFHVF